MSNTVTTPYMSLALPIPGLEQGPTYASDNNTAFTTIDSHTHVPGQGLPVPTAGLNINADLTFNSFNAITLRSIRLNSQSASLATPSDLDCLFVVNGELFYNDSLGQHVQITLNGVVDTSGSGNITGMGGTTASVVYTQVNDTFTFNSNTNTPAKMKFGPFSMGANSANPFLVNFSNSVGQSGDYNLILPSALPGVGIFLLTLNNAGQISPSIKINDATITTNAGALAIQSSSITNSLISDSTITAAKIADATITTAKIASATILGSNIASQTLTQGLRALMATGASVSAGGIATSSSSGTFTSSSTGQVAITNLSVTITTTGRPVRIALEDDGSNSAGGSGLFVSQGSATNVTASVSFFRDTTQLTQANINVGGATGSIQVEVPPSAFFKTDIIAAGTYTYTVKVQVSNGSATFGCTRAILVAYEI